MNCDDAFDLLTDPSRPATLELDRHLGLCPRCRQMRDVLEPALALFEGDDPPREPACDSAPARARTAPLLTPEAVQLAERAAGELRRASAGRFAPRRTWTAAASCAAVALVGLAVSFSAALLTGNEPAAPRGAATPVTGTVCLWQSPEQAAEAQSRSIVLSCMACHLD